MMLFVCLSMQLNQDFQKLSKDNQALRVKLQNYQKHIDGLAASSSSGTASTGAAVAGAAVDANAARAKVLGLLAGMFCLIHHQYHRHVDIFT